MVKGMGKTRKATKLYNIVTDDFAGVIECSKTAVFCYLYYKDTLEYYLSFIDIIPEEIKVYFITSCEDVANSLRYRCGDKKNYVIIYKPNRGRDISGLLVAARDYIRQYEYFCFIHDKAPRACGLEDDTDLWIENIWENLLGSENVIRNIRECFEIQSDLGLLVPLAPFGEHMPLWQLGTWGDNYDNTVRLANDLGLEVHIDKNFPPISLGTAFWAKTKALEKLFNKEWKYEDFTDEPLPKDGTLSHVIERVLPFVAQDAGYRTEIVVSTTFLPKLLSYMQEYSLDSANLISSTLGATSMQKLRKLEQKRRLIVEASKCGKNIYLYGAGNGGKRCLALLRMWNVNLKGFIVSESGQHDLVEGLEVYSIKSVRNNLDDSLVIITVMDHNMRLEICSILDEYGVSDYLVWEY